ncbi:MAG: exosortase/archaeosortase family protein [Verrucomicrobiales bacterium]
MMKNSLEPPTAVLPAISPGPVKSNTGFLLLSLVPSWLAMAWLVSRAQWFWNNRPDLQFGWVVLMLSAFIIWDKWAKAPKPLFQFNAVSFLFFTTGLGLLFMVQVYQAALGMMPASLMALAIGAILLVFGNLHYVFGWAGIRRFAFGFGFMLLAMPLPSAIYNPIVSGLQSKVAAINVEILNLSGVPAQRVGSLIHLPHGTIGVDEACSGIRSLQSTVMATLFIGYMGLRSLGLKVILLGAGITLAVFGNLIRSLYLSFTANSQGLKAVDTVHDAAGWSILIFTAIGVGLLAWGFNKMEKAAAAAVNIPAVDGP